MRRGTWILAVSGAFSLITGGASAAEPGLAPGFGQGPVVPSRYSRAATPPAVTAPSGKNYYDELFGASEQLGAEPATTKAPVKTAAKGEPAAPAQKGPSLAKDLVTVEGKSPSRGIKLPPSAPPTKQIPLDDSNRVFPAAAVKESESRGTVIQAGFDKAPGDKSYIQQVRATSEDTTGKAATRTSLVDASGKLPQVAIEWVKKSDINIGQECVVELVAKNTGTGPATQVQLEATFPTTVRLTSAEPKPASTADKLSWTFDVIPAGGEKRVAVKLIPSRRGDLGLAADVRYSSQAATVFKVEEPLLKIAVKGPKEVLLGDPASQLITITNPGTGVAHNVKLEAVLSEGLEHPRGQRLTIEIGSINPGDSQTVRLGLSAAKGGVQTLEVAAKSSSDAACAASEKVTVIAPSMKVAVDGPGLRYKGRNAKYTINVTNDGQIANNNVRVTQQIPEGFQFVSAERGGKYDSSQRVVQWFLGRMEAGQQAQISCELLSVGLGDFEHKVVVVSDAGVRSEAKTDTSVKGAASLNTEIVDLDDPVEVGVETAWEVRVRNDGSDTASNIAVTCELPHDVALISAKGPTQATADKQQLTFKPLGQLAPGQQAIFRIQVRGTVEGSHRLRAKVTSASLDEPLVMEEATRFYSDTKK